MAAATHARVHHRMPCLLMRLRQNRSSQDSSRAFMAGTIQTHWLVPSVLKLFASVVQFETRDPATTRRGVPGFSLSAFSKHRVEPLLAWTTVGIHTQSRGKIRLQLCSSATAAIHAVARSSRRHRRRMLLRAAPMQYAALGFKASCKQLAVEAVQTSSLAVDVLRALMQVADLFLLSLDHARRSRLGWRKLRRKPVSKCAVVMVLVVAVSFDAAVCTEKPSSICVIVPRHGGLKMQRRRFVSASGLHLRALM